MNTFALLTLLLVSVFASNATPVTVKRSSAPPIDLKNLGSSLTVDQSVVKYVDDSGKINYADLYADTAATPVTVSIVPTGSAAAPVASSELAASASAGATDSQTTISVSPQPTGSAQSKRSLFPVKRQEVQPAWDPSVCPASGQTKGVDVSNWDPAGFSGNSWISSLYAQNAGAPDGFSRVYVGANGIPIGTTTSITQAITSLDSYDVEGCKAACDYYNCQAFSVFATRDTIVDFNQPIDLEKCNNPPGLLLFGCAVYGSTITKDMINETGQMKGNYFKTAIAAANGYVRSNIDKAIEGYESTVYNGGTTSNGNTAAHLLEIYNPNENANAIGYQPDLCAARCDANPQCAGFDAAQTLADGNFVGTQCLLYNTAISSDQAYNAGQWGNDGKWYSFQPSVFYVKKQVEPESFYLKLGDTYPIFSIYTNPEPNEEYSYAYVYSYTTDKTLSLPLTLEESTNRVIIKQGDRTYYMAFVDDFWYNESQSDFWPLLMLSEAYLQAEPNRFYTVDGTLQNNGLLTLSNDIAAPKDGYTSFYKCQYAYLTYGNPASGDSVEGCVKQTVSVESAN